jgi:hypothetical protein
MSERFSDQQEALRAVLDGHQSDVWTALPGIIESVDFNAVTCVVQPAVQAISVPPGKDWQNVNLPLIQDVPLVFQRGGGYTGTFPIKAGDECLIVFSARCIDNWWQAGGVQPQFELRMHDLSDGFAITGPFSQKTKIDKISATTAQLRSDDGTRFIEIDTPNKKVRAVTDDIIFECDSAAGNINATATNQINLNAKDINLTGTGTITLKAPIIQEN